MCALVKPCHLEPWELAKREAEEAISVVREVEEDDEGILQEHCMVKESIAKKLEEDRARASNDAEASGSSKGIVEIIYISNSEEE